MRTIKFRGKSLTNKAWVIGDLHLISKIPHIHNDYGHRSPIDINTVGQFTGLLDNNGTEIFEGDVLLSPLGHVVIVKFGYKEHVVKHDIYIDSYASYGWIVENVDNKHTDFLDNEFLRGKVIGNIHDNPELLKGGSDEKA